MNYAIFLAGGTGKRAGGGIPKQYRKAGGRTMAAWAIRPLLESTAIRSVVVVIDDEWKELLTKELEESGENSEKLAGYVQPGENRQGSIVNGLREILCLRVRSSNLSAIQEDDTVLIHDAARPFLSNALLEACYKALPGHDGVMPVLPMKDTVYYSEDGSAVSKLLERQKIYAGQAPELFRLRKYYEANLALMPDRIMAINGASEPAILYGMDIAMIPGDEGNFKVTTAADLERFREQFGEGVSLRHS